MSAFNQQGWTAGNVINVGTSGRQIKRFVLFAGQDYYPLGGWKDYQGSYDTQTEAEHAMQTLALDFVEWFQIVDLQTGEFVVSTA